jgi:chromosomal replication initiation ATPase DnaA
VLRFEPHRSDPRGWRLAEAVARQRRVSMTDLLGRERGEAPIALARQIAMYLMHVGFGRHYAEVGKFFERDRTTVSHACALVEDMREDPGFDDELNRLEDVLAGEASSEREVACAAGW